MPRQNAIRPANANYQDLLVDFTGWDFSQFDGQQEKPQEEPGFLSKLGNSVMAIGEGLTMLPGGVVDTARDVWRGGDIDVNDADALRERQEREREQAEYARKYQGKTFEGVTDAMLSMPYSLTTMGASLGAGAVGAVGGPVAAGATGMAAAGTVAYRATKEDFMRRMLDQTKQVLGRMPSQEEWDRVAEEFDGEATRYGLWEAGPEALSNLFMAKLLGPLGKGLFRGSVGQGIKRVGGLYGEEFATETATQMGQGYEEERAGLREKAPGFLEAFGEIAPATFWQTTLMAGGKKGADILARRFRSRKAAVEANAGAEQGQIESLPAGREVLSLPQGNGAIPMRTTDTGLGPIPAGAATGQEPTHLSLDNGDTVDLLQGNDGVWGAAKEIGAPMPPAQVDAAPFPEAASFTMDAMLRPTVMPARPASNAFLSDAEHADSENFVRKFEEQERLEGDKAMSLYGPMSRMRESYPVSGGVLSRIGQQAMPLAVTTANPTAAAPVPTQAQITNTQTAPRADTMAQAEILGMPAPNPLAPGVQSGESRVQQTPIAPSNTQSLAPAMGPQSAIRETLVPPAASMPSFANTQYAGAQAESTRAITTAAPQARPRESRADLLKQLPPESQDEARRLTNTQLKERVRAERNPVRFDGETIGYTVEDYPMPTAQSGTVFTSASGRRMSPFPQVDYSTPRKHRASNAKVAAWLLDEARKEAAPNKWRSLLIRDRKADNLSPADVRELVDILSNGVEEETTPPFFKPVPAAVEPRGEGAPKIEQEKRLAKKIAESENGASEAEKGVVKSDTQAVENKRDAAENKELSHAPTDAQGSGVDDSGSHERDGSQDVSRTEGKRETGRSDPDAGGRSGRSVGGTILGSSDQISQGTTGRHHSGDADADHGLQQRLERGATDGDRVRRGTADRGPRRGRGSVSGLNYNAPVGALARTGSWKETAARNLDIIELSKRLDAEKRAATPEEQTLLAQYVGWGPADIRNRLFPSTNSSRREINPYAVSPDWRPLAERAAEMLSPEEVATAFQSTQYAHYTSEPMIRAIWSGLQRLGFKGGNILEPGMGTGLFAVASPSEVMEKSKYTGVEMDKATARIARHLLPESNILNADFVKQKLPDNFFDLAIGNPPFSATKILDDPAYKKYRFLLHDYFFAKSLDKVRPGGLLVFVTSKGTMDKADDKARNFMAERADLLGAVRLPQTAFKQNAGTEVVTDVLFLRKRQPGEAAGGESWLGRAEVKTPEGPALVNEYFARHPEMVLGEHSLQGSMRSANEYTVLPRGTDIDAQFAEAVTHLPENVYSPDVRSSADSIRQQAAERDFNPKHTKEGALYVDDKGLLRRLDNGSGVDIGTVAKLSDADRGWLKDYVELRDALKQAQYDQLQDGDWEASLKKLNQLYGAFVKKHGFINEFKEYERTAKNKNGEEVTTSYRRYKRKRLFDLDVEAPLIEQLEKITDDGRIVKQPFLLGRTIKRPVTPQIKNTNDALMVSLDQRGTLDLAHVAELAGKDRDAVVKELGDAVYEVPGADWQMADEYLSGDVVTKLEEAEAAAASDERFRRNVEALRKVQPKPLEAKNISVGLGAPWIPTEHLDAFVREILGLNIHIRYNKDSGTFSVPDANRRSARSGTSEWGTPDRSPQEILSAVLNNQSITIRVKDAQGKTRTDDTATTEANEKADKMRKAFESWIWQDAKRAGELVKIYNRTFNNIAPRRFDGSHLTLPGLSLRYKLYDHQKRAIWRIIQTGNVYLAHAVGAGKTLEMIVSGMEQRRLGLIQRPMYVVPNHMLRQFSSEFQDAYPLARIMVADEENFTGDNRRRFVAQAALNAPDAIVITHSAFKRIGTRPETIEATTRDFIAQLEEAIEDSEDRISRSRLEQRLEQAKRRTEARFSKSKDQAVFFEDMGVDFLYVDEAHGFRKLDFVTNRDRVKGIDPTGSEMALDLYSKLEWLRREHPGRSHVLASGTPVTNTMAELYTVMRYMDPEGLERDGLSSFDAWATMFGRVKADLEQNASGSYETVERFAKFVNVPELMKRVRGFMDVLTMSQLGDLVKRPDLKTGQPINVVAQASPAVLDYLKNVLAPRIQASKKWRPSAAEKGNPDPIVRIITDGRLAALDLRFVSDLAEDDPHSKLNLMIDDIIKTHHAVGDRVYTNPETGKSDAVKGGTQIVFSSVGFGEQVAARRGFDLRGFMMQRFKEGGIPASQVAWMGDYKTHAKKEAMFKDMRAGKVRVLIGSPQNMGTGVNVQKRLAKLHYLSPPWFPADVEQPHGRILRQGNQNPEVEINWYATKGTYDSTMWGMVARKARFIEQAFTGDDSVRTLEDISESSQYEMAAALAAGDERAIQLAGLNSDIERLSRLDRAHTDEQMRFRSRRRDIEHALEREAQERTKLQTALETLDGENVSADNFRLVIGKAAYTKQKEAGEALLAAAERALASWTPQGAKARESIGIGSAQGKCPLILHMDVGETGGRIGKRLRSLEVKIGRLSLEVQDFIRDEASAQGIATRLVNRLNGVERGIRESKARESELRREQESLQRRIGAPFPQEEELNEKIAEAARIQAELEEEGKKQAETEQQTEEGEDEGGMASLATGEYLPPRRNTRLGLRHAAAQRVADALGKTAKNAAPVHVVQRFDDLPANIRKKHAENAAALEGVYDPATGTVWLVADNLSDAGRVAEVWAHEQIVHHGLRGMLSDTERRTVLNQLWLSLGGMGNASISEVAKRYGLNPRSDSKARLTVMEEVLANLAEKRQAGSLDATEQGAWRKIVNAILRAWNSLVQAVSGRSARMGYGNVDALLADLGRYVMEGVPAVKGRRTGEKAAFASVGEDRASASRAAWEQVKKDTEAWGRQLDAARNGAIHPRQVLTVGQTPAVLQKLGAPDLAMTMTQNVLRKIGEGGKHGLPDALVRRLPALLAEPVMVFRSGTQANSLVALLETVHSGMPVVAAVHLDVARGSVHINDIASVHGRSGGFGWVDGEIRAGRRVYADKTKIPAWRRGFAEDHGSRRMSGLQLPGAFVLPNDPRGVKILTEKDVVKPVAPQEIEGTNSPLASLGKAERVPRDYVESIASGVRQIRKVMSRSVGEDVEEILSNPELGRLVPKNDLSIYERLFKLPHWIAKDHAGFGKVYNRQQQRNEERATANKRAFEEMPLLFDPDAKKRLNREELGQLGTMIWKWDGKEIGPLHGIEKFKVKDKTLNGRDVLEMNPRYVEKFKEWLEGQPEPDRVKEAFLQVRQALDGAFLSAYRKMADMSDLADTDLEMYRTDFGNIHNYFPHQRKGKFFVVATKGTGKDGDPKETVFRKHFDVPPGSSVREEWAKIVAANRKNFPGARWEQPREAEKLPDDILGAPIDPQAMEQIITAAAAKLSNGEQAEQIRSTLLTGVSDILKARGFGAHGIKRQGIPGFETEDIKGVLHSYIAGLNGWLTKMEAASDFAAALGKINAQKTPRLWEYASQYVKDMLRNSDQIDRIAGNIKTVAFAWYLGANFKTAVVNATQNAIIGVPRLQMYVTGGGAQWIKGAMDTIGLKYSGTGVRGARKLTADEESMLQELYGDGIITDAYMEEIRGQLSASPGLKIWDRFVRVLGKPMSVIEHFNRASLALAAYRAARAGAFRASALQEFDLKDGEKMNHEQARDFAAMLVRDSHYEYGKGNQPEFLRSNFAGRMASPIYTFRSFGFNTLNLWWRALRQEGWEGRAFVAKSLGATIVLGGLTAFPFYATMAALCAAASGDDEDWTSKIRKALPESDLMRDVVCYGLPALAGVNIGGSLRMETPFTEGIEKGTTFKEAMTESLGSLFGIPYDMAVNKPSKFFEAGKYGDGYKMIEALAPTFVANAMQAYRLATEGQTTTKGRPINSPGQPGARKLSGAEAMGKVLGFQPTSSAKSYEAYRAGKRQDAVRSDKVNDLAVLALKSIDTGNPDGRIAMMKELRAWNKKMQEEGKPHMLITLKDVMRRVNSRRRENRATPKAMQKRERHQAVWGS